MVEDKPAASYRFSTTLAWPDIERIRVSVAELLTALRGDPQVAEAVSMVSAELLENAVKHTSDDASAVDYVLEVTPADVRLSVDNSFSPQEERAGRLAETIDWVSGFGDPQQAYVERMQQIFESDNSDQTGLGLVRAAFEGHCRLSYERIDDRLRLRVVASFDS